VAYSRVRGWKHLHVLLPQGMFAAKNVVSREVLDMAFHDSSERPTSHRPANSHAYEEGFNQTHSCEKVQAEQRAQADAEFWAKDEALIDELYADLYDVMECPDILSTASAGHYEHDTEIDMVNLGCAALDEPEKAASICQSAAAYSIDYTKEYHISESGACMLLPSSSLKIMETSSANLNCAVASLRSFGIAFKAEGSNPNPQRWAALTADVIRPRLGAEYLKLKRADQLRLALTRNSMNVPATAEDEDTMIKKFVDEISTEGILMPAGAFWLICQLCLIQHGPQKLWSNFSVCLFQIDPASKDTTNVAVCSNNTEEWASFVHPDDNAELSSTVLAIVLHNNHYSSADILPRQNTGKLCCVLIQSGCASYWPLA